MKKILSLVLCLVCIFTLASCGGKKAAENTQTENPFTDCESLEKAAEITGFTLSAPDTLSGYRDKLIQVMRDEMIQIIFSKGADTVVIRKARGSGDISGDYNTYPEQVEKNVKNIPVTFKGEDEKVYLILWTNGEFSYSVATDTPVSYSNAEAFVETIE